MAVAPSWTGGGHSHDREGLSLDREGLSLDREGTRDQP
ncbi:hypothetical protein GA0115243_101376 [Streptomyces sp. ScaeMP-e83]|nr:hypothetical protein GA0115243_101376 [Streptomyces sp. ScaeMP-e83]